MESHRKFALNVVQQLRDAGHQAFWAGGCVRDALRGIVPKDYDVASTATPDQVIELFGARRTIAVGASFGVIVVLGPHRSDGQVEVATFRSDGNYSDGRRPETVRFSSPEEDAQRRDFTINGMFYDPIAEKVIDFVGGEKDLRAGIVRAIGDPIERFREDKLRMLRAVRFAATLKFELDANTASAVRQYASDLNQVSVERIAQELRRMLADKERGKAVTLLFDTELFPVVFPELLESQTPESSHQQITDSCRTRLLSILTGLRIGTFEPALAAILLPLRRPGVDRRERCAMVDSVCYRLKLSTEETTCVSWLTDSLSRMSTIETAPLHILKVLVADSRITLLLDLADAAAEAERIPTSATLFCREYMASNNREILCPEPLITGLDLLQMQVPKGPLYRTLLEQIRREQLDEILATRAQALDRLKRLISQL